LAGGDDPVGPAAGSYRVYRGGDWFFDASLCRSACRRYYGLGMRLDRNAFRVVVLC